MQLKIVTGFLFMIFLTIPNRSSSQINEDSLSSIQNLNMLVDDFNINYNNAKYEQSLQAVQKALKITKESFGRENGRYAKFLSLEARIYRETGNFDLSDSLFRECIEIFKNKSQLDSFAFASMLDDYAQLQTLTGNYLSADSLFRLSYQMLESMHLDNQSKLTGILINWSGNAFSQENYEVSEKIILPAKSLLEKLNLQNSQEYAVILLNLGSCYFETGRFDLAEIHFQKAKEIIEFIYSKTHPYYTNCIINLANIYSEFSNYQQAIQLLEEAKTVLAETLGRDNLLYADCIVNLGALFINLNNFAKSLIYYEEALDIWSRTLGKEHLNYAFGLMSLGSVELRLGKTGAAKLHLEQALSVYEKSIGKDKINYLKCLTFMAEYNNLLGHIEQSDSLYKVILHDLELVLGINNVYYLKTLREYGSFSIKSGSHWLSDSLYAQITLLSANELLKTTRHLTEKQLALFTIQYESNLEKMLTYSNSRNDTTNPFPNYCFDNIIMIKGFLLNSVMLMRNKIAADSIVTNLNLQMNALSVRLAREYIKPISERQNVMELEDKSTELEKKMLIHFADYKEIARNVNWLDLQRSLKYGEVAIEFIDFNSNDKIRKDSVQYAALIVSPIGTKIVMVNMFEERQLLHLLSTSKEAKPISELYTSRGAIPITNASLEGLYDLIWKPIEGSLKDVKTVYYSPSGLLHRINFDAIPVDKNTNLSDHYNLIRLGSTRSLVVQDLTKVNSSNEAILYGGIQYEFDTTSIQQNSLEKNILASTFEELSFAYSDRSSPQRGENWNNLLGTKNEIEGISFLLKNAKFSFQIFDSIQATEESFKSIGKEKRSPRVLHIATHGFFFPDPKNIRQSSVNSLQQEPVFQMSDHPMIRSGLILAGGNYAWKEGKPYKEGMEDGILTAYEISQMNLSNTELVVLSACETGLGDIQGNEGVYGLQRAFKIAGAKYLMMSLWQVPDEETKEFMITFYRNWLNEKRSIPDAFRITQKEMREKYNDPYLWAGFVLVE